MISFSEKAVAKVQEFAAQMPEAEGKELRIFIQGVGCSGFSYGFTFDEKRDGDTVVEDGKLKGFVEQRTALECLYEDAALDFSQLRTYVFKTGDRF